MYNSQYYTCEQIDQRLLQGYLDDYNSQNGTSLTKAQFLTKLYNALENYEDESEVIDLIEDYLGSGFLYAGLATPTGTPILPQDHQAQLFFIAISQGTYTNYGNITIANTGLHFIFWDTDTWSYNTVLEIDQQTGQSTTKIMSQKAITDLLSLVSDSNIKANIGYYECDTAGATAAKVISVANYALFVGGSIKVKMTNANTANNATLNINSIGAKPLYYNGELASASNTWEAGETVEVYYDGTNYQANNTAGGGKFKSGEKVSEVGISTSASDFSNPDAAKRGKLPSIGAVLDGAISPLSSQLGYYICDTAAATAAKTVLSSNYALSVGGSIKIKMTNANTAASGVTLKIGSAEAKPLYYAGQAVSASNTWQAGETVEVYYDGTNYQANNVAGGGGSWGSGDGVYDISAAHSGATYADLAAALGTNGANVPANVRQAGMSVKFANTRGIYEQWRYTGTATDNNSIKNVLNWTGGKPSVFYPFSDTPNAAEILKEIYFEGLSNITVDAGGITVKIYKGQSMIEVYNGSTFIGQYKNQTGSNEKYVTGTNTQLGLSTYAIINFSKIPNTYFEVTITDTDFVSNLFNCPRIKSIFDNNNNLTRFRPEYPITDYTDWVIAEVYLDGFTYVDSDELTIRVYKNVTQGRSYIQTYRGSTCIGFYDTHENLNLDGITVVPQNANSGVTGYVVVNPALPSSSHAYILTLNKANCVSLKLNPIIQNYLFNIELENLQSTIVQQAYKWYNKNILVIGDSMTADGRWQAKMGELLQANITTHAKGGMNTVQMVDGNGTDFPALTSTDVAGKDAIMIMGFYNDMNKLPNQVGQVDDMYPSQDTFTGRINYAIKRIYQELATADNLGCRVIIVSPHNWGATTYDDDEAKRRAALQGCYNAGKYSGCPVINVMENTCINRYTEDIYVLSPTNRLHLNGDGYNRLGEYLAAQIYTL